ncbi:kinase binding protein CGI-121-domain-containing protein [Chytriomyces sp. MP71]|nr:kinase binding protein CGI-121-domain-containing protein [Chytriomyces sp. MP71]
MDSIRLPSLHHPLGDDMVVDPSHASTVAASFAHVLLYEEVMNAAAIRAKVVAGDEAVPACVLVNPSLVLGGFQVAAAVARACMSQRQATMRTKTLHSEVLFALSPTLNITDSMKLFGVADSATAVLAIVLADGDLDAEVLTRLDELIDGKRASSEHAIYSKADVQQIEKVRMLFFFPVCGLHRASSMKVNELRLFPLLCAGQVYKLKGLQNPSRDALMNLVSGVIATKGYL